jgi:hypothetical protein
MYKGMGNKLCIMQIFSRPSDPAENFIGEAQRKKFSSEAESGKFPVPYAKRSGQRKFC